MKDMNTESRCNYIGCPTLHKQSFVLKRTLKTVPCACVNRKPLTMGSDFFLALSFSCSKGQFLNHYSLIAWTLQFLDTVELLSLEKVKCDFKKTWIPLWSCHLLVNERMMLRAHYDQNCQNVFKICLFFCSRRL